MSASSIQFHAAPEELLALTQWIANALDARVMCTEFPPSKTFTVPSDALAQSFDNEKFISFAFIVGPADGEESSYEPADAVRLQVERPNNSQLRQSTIGIASSKPMVLAAWKIIRRHVHKLTRPGVKVTNPTTKASGIQKAFRYTTGAKKLAENGVTMLPSAGGNIVTFEE